MGFFRHSRLFFGLFLLLFGSVLYGAEKFHVVEELNFIIQGGTRETALRKFVEIDEGDIYTSETVFRETIEDERQDLINYRVYDSVEVATEVIREDERGVYWRVTYTVVDSWTFVPIPYPKYSTNSGFRLAVQTDYANAFGTMTDINLNLGFNARISDVTGKLEISQWNFTPEWSRIKIGEHIRMTLVADMSLREKEYRSEDPLTQYHYSYYRTGLGATFVYDLPGDWSYRVSPYFDFRYGYQDVRNWGNIETEPFGIAVSHGAAWGQVNWRQNLREGQAYGLSHQIRYVYSSNEDNRKLVNDLDASARWYVLIGDLLNLYPQFSAFYVFNDERSGAGEPIRGVANSILSGQMGAYLQTSLAFPFWIWEGVWDAQIHPFFDIGYVGNPGEFDVDDNLKYGTGVDLVLYVDKLPTLVARATIGFNLSDPELDSLGDKLEIEITSSLSY